MMISKRRVIHALSYEVILLVIIAIALSFIFEVPMEVTGVLGVAMAVTSVVWNMVFNHFFEQFERKRKLKRTISVRILHAIGFEGGVDVSHDSNGCLRNGYVFVASNFIGFRNDHLYFGVYLYFPMVL